MDGANSAPTGDTAEDHASYAAQEQRDADGAAHAAALAAVVRAPLERSIRPPRPNPHICKRSPAASAASTEASTSASSSTGGHVPTASMPAITDDASEDGDASDTQSRAATDGSVNEGVEHAPHVRSPSGSAGSTSKRNGRPSATSPGVCGCGSGKCKQCIFSNLSGISNVLVNRNASGQARVSSTQPALYAGSTSAAVSPTSTVDHICESKEKQAVTIACLTPSSNGSKSLSCGPSSRTSTVSVLPSPPRTETLLPDLVAVVPADAPVPHHISLPFTLVPTRKRPERVEHFRPSSIVNVKMARETADALKLKSRGLRRFSRATAANECHDGTSSLPVPLGRPHGRQNLCTDGTSSLPLAPLVSPCATGVAASSSGRDSFNDIPGKTTTVSSCDSEILSILRCSENVLVGDPDADAADRQSFLTRYSEHLKLSNLPASLLRDKWKENAPDVCQLYILRLGGGLTDSSGKVLPVELFDRIASFFNPEAGSAAPVFLSRTRNELRHKAQQDWHGPSGSSQDRVHA